MPHRAQTAALREYPKHHTPVIPASAGSVAGLLAARQTKAAGRAVSEPMPRPVQLTADSPVANHVRPTLLQNCGGEAHVLSAA